MPAEQQPLDKRTADDTVAPVLHVEVDPFRSRRNYDSQAAVLRPGLKCVSEQFWLFQYTRRLNARLAVARTVFYDMVGAKRESFYERQLLHTLPWFCTREPRVDDVTSLDTWLFWCNMPRPEESANPLQIVMKGRSPYIDDVAMTFEQV